MQHLQHGEGNGRRWGDGDGRLDETVWIVHVQVHFVSNKHPPMGGSGATFDTRPLEHLEKTNTRSDGVPHLILSSSLLHATVFWNNVQVEQPSLRCFQNHLRHSWTMFNKRSLQLCDDQLKVKASCCNLFCLVKVSTAIGQSSLNRNVSKSF